MHHSTGLQNGATLWVRLYACDRCHRWKPQLLSCSTSCGVVPQQRSFRPHLQSGKQLTCLYCTTDCVRICWVCVGACAISTHSRKVDDDAQCPCGRIACSACPRGGFCTTVSSKHDRSVCMHTSSAESAPNRHHQKTVASLANGNTNLPTGAAPTTAMMQTQPRESHFHKQQGSGLTNARYGNIVAVERDPSTTNLHTQCGLQASHAATSLPDTVWSEFSNLPLSVRGMLNRGGSLECQPTASHLVSSSPIFLPHMVEEALTPRNPGVSFEHFPSGGNRPWQQNQSHHSMPSVPVTTTNIACDTHTQSKSRRHSSTGSSMGSSKGLDPQFNTEFIIPSNLASSLHSSPFMHNSVPYHTHSSYHLMLAAEQPNYIPTVLLRIPLVLPPAQRSPLPVTAMADPATGTPSVVNLYSLSPGASLGEWDSDEESSAARRRRRALNLSSDPTFTPSTGTVHFAPLVLRPMVAPSGPNAPPEFSLLPGLLNDSPLEDSP